MRVVAFGGGTNSTAMLIGLHERGIRPDLILFADTGGEKPGTYTHITEVSEWCESVGFPPIITVRYESKGVVIPLYELSMERKMLPSIAYGYKACSHKWKQTPQNRYVSQMPEAQEIWRRGEKVIKFIGYDADEERRAHIQDDGKYDYQYPLIEWGWGRDECVEAISRAGISQPGKSACFFCPNSKPAEILALPPELQDKAVAMEENAELTSIAGLGRTWKWGDLIRNHRQQEKFDFGPEYVPEMPCGCYDG